MDYIDRKMETIDNLYGYDNMDLYDAAYDDAVIEIYDRLRKLGLDNIIKKIENFKEDDTENR